MERTDISTLRRRRRDTVRGAGWARAHVAIDAASRLAYAEVLPDEGQAASTAVLERALAWFAALGVRVERIMTDNAPGLPLAALHHVVSPPPQPSPAHPALYRTNGKAERFIQTALREWVYQRPYASSQLRTAGLTPWLHATTAIGPTPPSAVSRHVHASL